MEPSFDWTIFQYRELIPVNLASIFDFSVKNSTSKNTIPCRFYIPKNHKKNTVILFVHGGGWCMGNLESHNAFCTHLASVTKTKVCALAYRLSPQFPFPHALQDVQNVYLYLNKYYSKIILSGDSSGGNLCLALTQILNRKFSTLLFYPVLDDDFTTPSYKIYGIEAELNIPMMHYFWNNYAPPTINRNQSTLCPQKSFNLNKLSKSIIISAEKDVLFSEAEAFSKKLIKASIPVKHIIIKNAKHGFMTYGQGHLLYALRALKLIHKIKALL